MKNIVVFGKPKSFESYEFEFQGISESNKENTHIEPLLKPKKGQTVLHYFVKEGYACFEYYEYAKGFESDRLGSVFGIGLKSDNDINLTYAIDKVLIAFWSEFASSFLNENDNFILSTMVDSLKTTKFGDEEIQLLVNSTNNLPFNKNKKSNILLLVAADLTELKAVESQIKEYSEVYIADNPDIFKDSINDLLLSKINNQIFRLKEGVIVPFEEKKPVKNNEKKPQNWGVSQPIIEERVDTAGKSETGVVKQKSWCKRNYKQVLGSVAVICLLGIGLYNFWPDPNNEIDVELNGNTKNVVKDTNSKKNGHSETLVVVKEKDSSLLVEKENKSNTTIKKEENNSNLGTKENLKEEKVKYNESNTVILLKRNGIEENSKTVYKVGEKIEATASSGGVIIKGGEWKFEDGLFTNKSDNPTTVEIKSYPTNGEAFLRFYYKNKKIQGVKLQVSK